ncbi:MAG TPA: arsenate reductase ArsC [Anaerovoracaceae bacterium]|nr:arsenate reductase ArsC [Anaerovoracaceae bacterium]
MNGNRPKVAFVCVHNSCRSQMAEAISKLLAADAFEAYSAGTETKPRINQDAVRIMKQLYHIDMEETQYSKTISELPEIDIVITMGCNVECPWLPCSYREDWGLEDPTGKSDEEFIETAKTIERKVLELKERIISDQIFRPFIG